MSNTFKNFFYFIFFFTIVFLLIFYCVNNKIGFDRHWSVTADQEVTLVYNALLYNSAKLQEYNEHSGTFTILFLSFWLKALNILSLLDIDNLTKFNADYENFNQNLQNLVFYARIFSLLSITLFLSLFFIIAKSISDDLFLSFFLTLIFCLFTGFSYSLIALRTETFSLVFFIIFYYFFICFFYENKDQKNLYFCLLFLFCSILNKNQVFYYLIPILFFSMIYLEKKIELNFKFLKIIYNNKTLYYIFFFLFVYLISKYLTTPPNSRYFYSIFFILINLLLINYIFYYFSINKKIIIKNLININIIIIFTFIIFKNILFIHPSMNEISFQNSFTNILSNIVYSAFGPKTLDFKVILERILFFFKYCFFTVNYHSFLIYINLGFCISLLFSRKKDFKKLKFSIANILIFFSIFFINFFRHRVGLTTYYLMYSDIFLLYPFMFYFKSKNNFKKISILCLLVLIIYKINIPEIKRVFSNIEHNNLKLLCKNTYMGDWHKNLNLRYYYKMCGNLN